MALIKSVRGFTPEIGENCFLADNATIIGDVKIGNDCSIWFCTVLRGDVNSIRIGNGVNIQAFKPLIKFRAGGAGFGQAGYIALGVGQKNRHAYARKAFRQHLKRHRLAGSGCAGYQAVAVGEL